MPPGALQAANTGSVRLLMMTRVKELDGPAAASSSTHCRSGIACRSSPAPRVDVSPSGRCVMIDWYAVSGWASQRALSSAESMRSSCTRSSSASWVTTFTTLPR